MADITVVELQAVAGGLLLAKRTLDDVLVRVTANPGPIQDPAGPGAQALATIIATSQLITAEAQQIQALANPTGAGG